MADISVPEGGGAIAGIGETFQPDLQTGTGNLSVPVPVPPGRGGLSPTLALTYSSGLGNGPFGLGWSLAAPRVSRRTDRGVPTYDDTTDVFVLSGAEELAPVPLGSAAPPDLPAGATAVRYRPRTEAGFARIVHVTGDADDYWDVWSRDGLRSRYGTARPAGAAADWADPAAIRDPDGRVFSWLLSATADSLGNTIAYEYRGDGGAQRYLQKVSYADYGDPADPAYAVTVTVTYNEDADPRPDPFSDRKPGFELRTTLRATQIAVSTVGGGGSPASTVDLGYADQVPGAGVSSALSLLTVISVTGHDPAAAEPQALPPLTFTYRGWDPAGRRYRTLPGTLPPAPLGGDLDLVDLFGDGLPSVLQLDSTARYWRNRGDGTVDLARPLLAVPGGVTLGAPGVLLTDLDGDGRADLAVTADGRASTWSLAAGGFGGQAGFAPSGRTTTAVPAAGFGDPQVRLVDLDGDHVPDLLLGGSTAAVATGDGMGGFGRLRPLPDPPPPLADLADPHVQLADMTGDGLTDVVLVHDGAVRYWPGLGYGRFGPPVSMTGAPRFADAAEYAGVGFDPRRLLLGDVTGDGTADAIYVADGSVSVWINQSGNGFAAPVMIRGTPRMSDVAAVRVADFNGTGVAGLLWSGIGAAGSWAFLDLTGGVKPYLLTGIDNHRGASTTLAWSTSTAFAAADRSAGRPWRTTLPFPVHVLAASQTTDEFAGTLLTSGFIYHEGYWDPADREFRGFGRVEQIDTLTPVVAAPAAAATLTPLDPLIPASQLPDGFDAAAHGNLLRNWSFDQARDGQPTTLTTTPEQPSGGGLAAAAEWTTWNNTTATTVTELRPSDLPQGRGGSMLHVTTDGAGCGIVQTFLPAQNGPARVVASAWVKVVRGSILLGTGDGGDTGPDATCDLGGQWIFVRAGNQRAPANEFIIYAAGEGGAEFYVDHAWISVPDVPAQPVGGPPTRTVTWFHLGPIGPAAGDWAELDPSAGFWAGDPPLQPYADLTALAGMPRPALREALRGLRGRILRTELYADDGDPERGDRPYQVGDSSFQVVPVLDGRAQDDASWLASPVVTVRDALSRTATWDRGSDPLTRLTVTGGYDDYGRPHAVAQIGVARGRDPRQAGPASLASVTTTEYATRDDETLYRLDRVCATTRHEAADPGTGPVLEFAAAALAGSADGQLRALELSYYDGPAFTGLGLGELGDHGLPVRTERLVITPDQLAQIRQPAVTGGTTAATLPYLGTDGSPPTDGSWTAGYPAAFRDAVQQAPAGRGSQLGYLWHDAASPYAAGYYAQASRISYDVHAPVAGRVPRGLPLVSRDAYGGDTTTAWDAYDLLPSSITSPAGLATQAGYDYRVLKPSQVTDPNGNRTAIGYTPLGLPAWIARLGKDGKSEGDTTDQPGQSFAYNLTAYDQALAAGTDPQPVSVTTVRRVDHRWTLVGEENARRTAAGQAPLTDAEIAAMFSPDEAADHPERFLRTVEFSDGLGRPLQTRTQADELAISDIGLPDDLSPAARTVTADPAAAAPAVIVSGWTVYDDKGRPVIRYEPFRDAGYGYAAPGEAVLAGLAATMQHYDPAGRPTVTVAPDGSQTWVVRGVPASLGDPGDAEPTPWETYTYSANDNASRTHPTGTLDLAAQWDTPSSAVIDALGRTVSTVERGLADDVVTSFGYDIDGHLLSVTDPLGRLAAASVCDLAGQAWLSWQLDAGAKRAVYDAAGGVVEHRDDSDGIDLTAYDAAHRAIRHWAADRASQDATLRVLTIFGDDQQGSGLRPDEAADVNALGRVMATYNEAGQVTSAGYDLDGNQLGSTRRMIRPDALMSLVPALGSGQWSGTGYAVDWQPAAGQALADHAGTLLDPVTYRTDGGFDALGRQTASTCPEDVTGKRAAISVGYGRGGGVTSVTVDGVPYLNQAGYDAHGRRSFAFLGNGVLIRYRYDPGNLRLRRLRAEHATVAAAGTWACDGPVLQDGSYRYDLAGNLLTFGDRTPGCGIPPADPGALDRQFGYDALGRLVTATGREADVAPPQPWIDSPRGTDVTKVRAYAEGYRYDATGSMLELQHRTDTAGTGAYTRAFAVAAASNQLNSLSVGNFAAAYTYDPCGNMSTEGGTRFFEWDHAGRLSTFRDQAGAALPTVYGQYRYDPSGQRVMKIIRRNGGPDEITLYLDGFERVLRGTIGSDLSSFDEVQLQDRGARLAAIRRGDPLPDDPMPDQPVKYQLTDPLLSVTATLTPDGSLLNREEYLPFGETSFGSYARKRYRFAGKQRDEESGLCYHGQRYYAPWLARWHSGDPAHADGLAGSQYQYCRDNPVNRRDSSGLASELTQESSDPNTPDLDLVRGPFREVGGHHTQMSAANRDPATGKDPFRLDMTTTVVGEGDFSQPQHNAASNLQNRLDARMQGTESGTYTVEGQEDVAISGSGEGQKVTPSPWYEQVKAFFAWRAAGAPGKQALELVDADVSERAALAAATGRSPLPTRVPGRPLKGPAGSGFASVDLVTGLAGLDTHGACGRPYLHENVRRIPAQQGHRLTRSLGGAGST